MTKPRIPPRPAPCPATHGGLHCNFDVDHHERYGTPHTHTDANGITRWDNRGDQTHIPWHTPVAAYRKLPPGCATCGKPKPTSRHLYCPVCLPAETRNRAARARARRRALADQ